MSETTLTNGNAIELVNKVPEIEVDGYNTPHLAEFYDIYWASTGEEYADIPTYWKVIQQQLKSTGRDRLVVLDLATGSGRIIKGLAQWSPETPDEGLSRVDFIGLDIADSMLERARNSKIDVQKLGHLTWIQGDWFDLASALPQGCKADVIILALGTVMHLTDSNQLEKLLAEVKKVLDPQGRFYLALLDAFLPGHVDRQMFEEGSEIQLLSDPDLLIRDTPRRFEIGADNRWLINSSTLIVRRDRDNRRDVVVGNYSVTLTGLARDPDSIKTAVARAGLRTVDEFHSGSQTYLGIAL